MTGPEHYLEAERLLAEEVFIDTSRAEVGRTYTETVAAAQVHATLALAAATALNLPHPQGGFEDPDSQAWYRAASAGRKR